MSIIKYIFDNVNRAFVYSFLVLWILIMVYITTRMGLPAGIAVSLIPLMLLFFIMIMQNPDWGFIFLFIANYFVSGLSRYIKAISPGIIMDFIVVVIICSLFFQAFNRRSYIKWSDGLNQLTLLAFIWFLYCLFEIFNPNSSVIGWITAVRGVGVYFFMIVVFAAIILRRYSDLKRILFIWAILSLIAVLKGFVQKNFGFDYAETRWLFDEGGRVTHIIYSGVRYFSFFTDAANFGTGIAFSGVVFAISSFYFKKTRMKIFYLFIAVACAYGMLISGTRGSLAVPFVAFTTFVFLSKKIKYIVLTTIVVVFSFIFLKYTYYGQGNAYIRRMRSAFNTEDASFRIRIENQMKRKTYMLAKPFGVGLGMSKGRTTTFRPDPFLSTIPNDSWYVLIWVETGIVGLILHLLILLYIVFYGAYLVLFKLKNEQLKGMITAFICGLSGIYVASYSLEIIGQFPSGYIIYTCMAFIFLSPLYDKELEKKELQNQKIYETVS